MNIYSDSGAAILAVKCSIVKSELVSECKIVRNLLAKHAQVRLIWVPGYLLTCGNNGTGSLTIEDSSKIHIVLKSIPQICVMESQRALRSNLSNIWQNTSGIK